MIEHLPEPFVEHAQFNHLKVSDGPARAFKAITGHGYAYDLRVIGQLAEGYSFVRLNVERIDNHYQVRGQRSGEKLKVIPFSRLLLQWFAELGQGSKARIEKSEVAFKASVSEIFAADMLNQKCRKNAGATADAYHISQTLRAVGFYLDTRPGAELRGISIGENRVIVEYENPAGTTERIEQMPSFFYDYWIQMYLQRKGR